MSRGAEGRGTSVLPRLPTDLAELVLSHWAASVIWRAFLRWSLWAHCRRRDWSTVRARMVKNGAYPGLCVYAGVRREWREEVGSWEQTTDETVRAIWGEAREGLWGGATRRLPLSMSSRQRSSGAPRDWT